MAEKKSRGRPRTKTDPIGFAPDLDGVAEHLEISLRALHNALKRFASDRPKHRAGGPYPLSKYGEWAAKHAITGRRKSAELENEAAVKLAHAKLRLAKEEFEFERIKDRMLPAPQFEAALARMLVQFNSALDAFGPRVNEQLEGLDYDDRALVIARETAVVKKTLASCDYLAVEDDEDE